MHRSLFTGWIPGGYKDCHAYPVVMKCSGLDHVCTAIEGLGMEWPYLWSSYSSFLCSRPEITVLSCYFYGYEMQSYCDVLDT